MAGDRSESAYSYIPCWDGNPAGWITYREEVRIWSLGVDTSVKSSLAARLVARLTGPARRAALSLKDDQLMPTDDDPKAGIKTLLDHLRTAVGQDEAPIRKGESMEEFFEQGKYRRKMGEQVSDWITRWDEGVRKMEEDKISFLDQADLAGWWFIKMASLTTSRRELLMTKVPEGKDYDVISLKHAMIVLFSDLHVAERAGKAQIDLRNYHLAEQAELITDLRAESRQLREVLLQREPFAEPPHEPATPPPPQAPPPRAPPPPPKAPLTPQPARAKPVAAPSPPLPQGPWAGEVGPANHIRGWIQRQGYPASFREEMSVVNRAIVQLDLSHCGAHFLDFSGSNHHWIRAKCVVCRELMLRYRAVAPLAPR